MNQQLNFKRLGYLGRTYLINDWRSLAIAGAAISGVIFVVTILQTWFSGSNSMDYRSFLIGTMVIWGVVNASMAFTALHDKNQNEAFLLLPASALEKVGVPFIFSSILLPMMITALISLTSVVTEGVTGVIFRTGFHPLNPFQKIFFQVWGYTVIGQSLFILGSAWFKKAHFIKTVLAVILGLISLGILSGILFRIVFASYFEGFFTPIPVNLDVHTLLINDYPGLLGFLKVSGRVLFYGLLAPFCWFVTWLRVKETQSSDGV